MQILYKLNAEAYHWDCALGCNILSAVRVLPRGCHHYMYLTTLCALE